MIVYVSSGVTASRRCLSSASSRPRPRSRRSSSEIASATSPLASIAITCLSAGRLSRTSTILATWEASSQTIATDSELPATHSHSLGELVG